ncbi:HNH endonuclease [Corynebacterium sp. sy017]|uniref:HNH endonuclease family protein n=1 Tax=unclassified Corynebacterium TaxID=2624378 RepID=UPI001185D2EA|nr:MULTISPECIES: HNH endonuclease family protein [unclassified Corynebacterium]MBP3089049.1 HNH endonuclease [Corynebacterium sp. sy017]TSD91367.1 HNH endonuclease [Corynebacterium sp. SY003]
MRRVAFLCVVGIILGVCAFSWKPGQEKLDTTSMSELNHQDGVGLEQLHIRTAPEEIPQYDRAFFGQRWSDDVPVEFGHNGCDTRNDILHRDLTNVVLKPRTHDCVVLSGKLHDPYSAKEITFTRGQGTSERVQIDHIVALADAWYSGAYMWNEQQRRTFANDPANLLATTQQENEEKKAKTIDKWLPSNKDFHCQFARDIVAIKNKYQLSVSEQEHRALKKVLGRCSS